MAQSNDRREDTQHIDEPDLFLCTNQRTAIQNPAYCSCQFRLHTLVFKKRSNFLNSSPTSKEGALRLLSATRCRF
jgi:hypothetical protein